MFPQDDDHEPFPDWMLAETHRNNKQQFKPTTKSLNESILEAMKKPAVPIVIPEPKE